jgi:Protein of unknown function (DUF1565).
MARELHVAKSGNDKNDGCQATPFLTINKAAKVALPGDTVIVHEGTYRERVSPQYGGLSDTKRITYQAAEGEAVTIKGSEIIKDWELVEGTTWKVVLPNSFFEEGFNPFIETIHGDWFVDPPVTKMKIHAGEVYLNGRSFYEAKNLELVKEPKQRLDGYNPPWTKRRELIPHPEETLYTWCAKVDDKTTTIYANFHEANPKKELVEINVRKYCFFPDKTGLDYLTVKGFRMCQAASTWAPPSADQPGLIGVNWSKGWIIEDNIIHDAKCSGISIGKEASTGDNLSTKFKRKPGYQHQMESVFMALNIGWSKESVGSHVIRNNTIYDCGQTGIVGHLGCVFSKIYDNEIYNIGVKHEFFGHEIAGIKLHAAIDTQIYHNNLHGCTLGLWLDWQAQGTRVSRNIFYNNDRDLFIEVTHGPHIVDNNILASDYNFDNIAWGGAYVNNLCCGTMRREQVLNRATPYHYPHSTKPLGTTFVYGADDRWYQNIFIGGTKVYTEQSQNGTSYYDGHPSSLAEYIERVLALGNGDLDKFEAVKGPAYINNNAYLRGAPAYDGEQENFLSKVDPQVKIKQKDGQTFIEINIEKEMFGLVTKILTTDDLEMVRIVEAPFENPDGTPITFDIDLNGLKRNEQTTNIGPFANLKAGINQIRIWG